MEESPREGCYLIWLRRLLDKEKAYSAEDQKTTLVEGCYLIWLRRLLDKEKKPIKTEEKTEPLMLRSPNSSH